MDAKIERPLRLSFYSPRYNVPVINQYLYGSHNPSINGGKLYERTRIKTLAEERERIQKKTFTKWSNTFLGSESRQIEDLFKDLFDGRILLKLIERVSGYKMPAPTPGRMRIHCLENVEKSLAFLDQLNVHLENIGAHDIVDGNSRIILGLIWTIILRFQIQNISVIEKVRRVGNEEEIGLRRNSTEALLLWCKAKTQGYPNVEINNFTNSWRDGLGFAALIHKHRPDLIDFHSLSLDEPLRNLHIAFTTAERCFGIPKLLDPEDIVVGEPEEKSIITYLVSFYHYFALEKLNTVHARRIDRVVNLLMRFINEVKDYELSAEKLLNWINESIQRLQSIALDGNLDDLRNELVQFNRFRIEAKPPHFYEKGELEVAFLSIKNEMLAAGMRSYIPPKRLTIWEVNKSWEDLEHCEYEQWLNLNDELKRQEMLDQLYLKFETKCTLRESWLFENQQIAEQEVSGTSQYALTVVLKKHEAFEADVYAYEDRIEMLLQIADELRRCGYFREERINSRSQNVASRWLFLLETIKNQRALIQAKIFYMERNIEFEILMKFGDELRERIDRIEPGNTFEQIQHALLNIESVDNEIKTLCIQVDNLLKKHRDAHSEELEKEWSDVVERIVLSAEEKRRRIMFAEQQCHLLPGIACYREYVKTRMKFVEDIEFQFVYTVVNRIHRQVCYAEEDISEKQKSLNLIDEFTSESKYDREINDFKASWRLVNKVLGCIKTKAIFVGDVLFLCGEIEDSDNWIMEKSKILELNDSTSMGLSVRVNQQMLEEVEAYFRVIKNINEKATTLREEFKQFDYIPNEFNQTYDTSRLVKSLFNVRNEVECTLTEKTQNLFEVYSLLVEKIKKKQAVLIDVLSVEQFLSNCSQTHEWIVEKCALLERLEPVNLDTEYEKGISDEMRERLDFKGRRLDEIEKQMIEMAEKVMDINKTAANIIDAANSGKMEDAEAVLLKVTGNRNKLSDAWNKLADRVEDGRFRLNVDQAFLNLAQDCFFTSGWIDEKLMYMNNHVWNNVSTVLELTKLNMVLKSLKSDARVIRAKVDDIAEQVTACYEASDSSLSKRQDLLLKRHDALCGKLAQFEKRIEECDNMLIHHGGHLRSVQCLGDFLKWVNYLKEKNAGFSVPSNVEEIKLSMVAQEEDLKELLNAEEHLEGLLEKYEKVMTVSEGAEPTGEEIGVDPDQIIEEYASTCDLFRRNITNLEQSIAVQGLVRELGSLKAAVIQQDVYLNQQPQMDSLEAVQVILKEHETFMAPLISYCNRYSALDRKARDLLGAFRGSEDCFIAELDSLRESLERNKGKSNERERLLKENLRLYEMLSDFDDIEDWMGEKSLALNQVKLTSKRDIASAYAQVKVLQEEIESSRERTECIIQAGKDLINQCPRVDHVVSARIDDIYVNWESLLHRLHSQLLSLEESQREFLLNETVQDLLCWAERLLSKVKNDIEDPGLCTSGLTELQSRFEAHERDCHEYEKYSEEANVIKEHTESLSQFYPDRATDFSAVNTEVEKQLVAVDEALERREELLNLHCSITGHLLELNSELLWVKDKLVQIRQPYDDWTPKHRSAVGKQLLRVQQEKRRLTNHITEVENRGPRVKNLCIRVKETYLGAEANAGARLESFRDVLGELEQAWYTVTHLLEVRREELRLADAIHKFSFDAYNLEAWMSERELCLQSISDPTNMEEGNRALRRLNVLNESLANWSNETNRIKHRANELVNQLSTGVQINGNFVIAPPVTKSFITNTAKRLVNDFLLLGSSVGERRKDLLEAITLHDLMLDINDLEDWIAECQKTANNVDVGTDLEHTFTLHDRFEQFSKRTRTEGERRMRIMIQRIDQMILRGHRNRSDIALAKDGLNEDYADLLEMLTTRSQLLKSSLTLHRFFYDTQYLEKQIENCYQYLPTEPTIEMVTGRSKSDDHKGIANLRRKEAGLAMRLSHINAKCEALSTTANKLLPAYGGESEVLLRVRRDCVISAAQKLASEAKARSQLLAEAVWLQSFFTTAQHLLEWLSEAKDKMSQPNNLSRTAYGIERLIGEHRQLYAELGVKVKQVEDCLDEGRSILSIGMTPVSTQSDRSRLWRVLTAPRGEVREVCVSLATERILAEAMWRERWVRLTLLLDARYFLRDASAAESWLGAREVYLVSVRRNIGENLAETLALLGAHYAFERACASADERFNALKRLTKMEIQALEWKPEDVSRQEKEKRDKIRRAIHEFLPPPPEGFHKLPPQVPPSMPDRQPPPPASREPGLVKQASLGPIPSPKTTLERASALTRTIPLPQKRISRFPPPNKTGQENEKKEISNPARPPSPAISQEFFYARRARVPPPKSSLEDPITSTTPLEETASSTRPQGSFPSTSAHTPPPEQQVEVAEPDKTVDELPRVEGPLIRKWESDVGGTRRNRGRGWVSIYVTLMDGKLRFYKDRCTRRENEHETLHGEEPLDLGGAISVPALDYTKRPFVFRLRLFTGAEYLFQAVSSEVLKRWVEAINESASRLTPTGFKGFHERAHSLPSSARCSRASSSASGAEKRRHSSLRRILKRS
nr:spectrin beta chain [Hymenolepis microstoma]